MKNLEKSLEGWLIRFQMEAGNKIIVLCFHCTALSKTYWCLKFIHFAQIFTVSASYAILDQATMDQLFIK